MHSNGPLHQVIYNISFCCVCRKAFMISWSNKPTYLPCYSGVITKLPCINKKRVHSLLYSDSMYELLIVISGSSSKLSPFPVQVVFEILPILILQIYPLALAVR